MKPLLWRLVGLVLTGAALMGAPALAQAEEEERAERERALFGDAEESVPDDEAPRPSSLEDIGELQAAAGADVLRDLDRLLDVGGRMYLALQYTQYASDGSPPFPPLTSPSLLDLYADARPSPRVRGYVEARFDYDFTVDPDASQNPFGVSRLREQLRLDQLWLKLDASRVAYFTLGKQRIRWGTGRFWNPTDFLNTRVRDPLDVFDRRLGVTLAKAHFPLEALGSNLYLIGDLEDIQGPDEVGLAARAEALLGTTEITTSAAVRKGEPLRFGADVSSGVWIFDLRAEGAAVFNSDQPFFTGDVDLAEGVLPREVSRANEWIFQLVLGGDVSVPYSSTDSAILGAEYFFNDAGYEDADLYPLLFARGAFRPLYVGRHYAAVYAAFPQPGTLDDSTVLLSTIGNLSDQSFLTRIDFSTLVLTFLTLNVWAVAHYGREGELRLGLDLPPQPGVPQLADGLTLAPPLVDVGGALTLAF